MGAVINFMNRNKDFLTVSETAANNKLGRHVFFWGLLISGIAFLFLMFRWVIPENNLGPVVSWLSILLFSFQILTGIIPARGKRLNEAHLFVAFGLGICMCILITIFALSPTINAIVRLFCALIATSMIALIAATRKLTANKYFRHQNIFFACWHIAFFCVVYFG